MNLRQSNQGLPLSLRIITRTCEGKSLLCLMLCLLLLSTLEQQFRQTGMTERSRYLVIEFTLNGDRLPILLLSAFKIVLLLQGFPKPLVCQTNQALLITHFIDRQTTQCVFTRYRQLADSFVVLTDIHILLCKTLTITIHRTEQIQ